MGESCAALNVLTPAPHCTGEIATILDRAVLSMSGAP